MRATAFPARRRTTAGLCILALTLGGCSEGALTGPRSEPRLSPSASPADDLSATPPGHVRVGVVPEAAEVSIGAPGAFTIRNKATGEPIVTGTGGDAVVALASGVVVHSHYRLQVAFYTSAASRDELVARARGLGYVTYVEPYGSGWRVYVGQFPSNASFSVRSAFRNQAIADGVAAADSFWRVVSYTEGVVQLQVRHDEGTVVTSDPVVLEAADGLVRIGGRAYRGRAEVRMNGKGTLAGVNELPLEQYLYGVVPRELPPVPYGEPEAQKAQAVAARTYALANLGKRRTDGYDLLPTTSDQVYGGYSSEHPVSSAAVDATAGEVAVADGRLITTLYHSTSGGYTANNEDVYSSAPVSYLRAVPDAERGAALEQTPTLEAFRRYANPTNLRAAAEGDFESDWSRYHRWVVSWTREELARALSSSFGRAVNQVYAVEVVDRAEHGRVREIRFQTDAGPLSASKDAIRTRLPYFTSTGTLASLRSTLFFVEPQVDRATGETIGWKAYGGGWGHGVGMSQTGAVGMAKRGHTYEQILKHYYRGVQLQHR